MSNLWLAFIESNTSGTGRLFARAAIQQGLRPILLTADPARYPYAKEDGIAVLRVDTQNMPALLDTCQGLAAAPGLAGITSSSEYFIAAAATIAKRIGLPGPSPIAIQTCRDKYLQRLCLREAGVGVPTFRAADSVPEAIAAATSLGFPVVVKPVAGSGSVGVKLCTNADQVRLHAEALLGQQCNERGLPMPRRILVEKLAVGPEYSVETFSGSILGITRKHLGALPDFVEVGHDFPAELAAGAEAAIYQTVQRSLDALDLRWGPAHVELRLTSEGPIIIEINPRLAGGYIPVLVQLAYGVDLVAEMIRLVVGREPGLRKLTNHYASIRFITPPCDGRLMGVNGLDVAKQLPDVAAVELYPRSSNHVRRFGDFRDRIGHVITRGPTFTAACRVAELAHREIQVCIQPD